MASDLADAAQKFINSPHGELIAGGVIAGAIVAVAYWSVLLVFKALDF